MHSAIFEPQHHSSAYIALAALLLLNGSDALAQEPSVELPSYTFYTESYLCDWSRHAEADALFEKVFQPAFELALQDGVILGWSYLKRALGDEWGRVITLRYATGKDIFEIRQELWERVPPEDSDVLTEWFKICGPHRENIYRAVGRP